MNTIGITERGDAAVHFDELTSPGQKFPSLGYDGVVLITKDPMRLYALLQEKDQAGELDTNKLVVHCTITGWGGSILEPNVPLATEAFKGYTAFVDWLGPRRTVLRVDPIVPTKYGFQRAKALVTASVSRVRISFLDLYPYVRQKLSKRAPNMLEELEKHYNGSMHCDLDKRKKAYSILNKTATGRTVEICGEPDMNVTGCISPIELKLFGLKQQTLQKSRQRGYCACLACKTEMLMHKMPCKHQCLYCYWGRNTY